VQVLKTTKWYAFKFTNIVYHFFVQLGGVEVHDYEAVQEKSTALSSCSAKPMDEACEQADKPVTQATISLSQSPPTCSQVPVDLTSSQDSQQFVVGVSSNVAETVISVPEGNALFLN
jgi:hypothetical protein